jgi:hypothetical protein
VYREPYFRIFTRAYTVFEAGKPPELLKAIQAAPIAPYTDAKSLVIPGHKQRLKHPAAVKQVAGIRAYWRLKNACKPIVADCLDNSDVSDPGMNDNIARRMHAHLKCLLGPKLDKMESSIRDDVNTLIKGCSSKLKRGQPSSSAEIHAVHKKKKSAPDGI